MLKTERKVNFRRTKKHKVVSLEKLVGLRYLQESTVRRIRWIGVWKLRRVHGGAEFINSCKKKKPFAAIQVKNLQEKKIAQSSQRKDVILWMQEVRQPFSFRNWSEGHYSGNQSIHHAVQLVDKQIPTALVVVLKWQLMRIGGVASNRLTVSLWRSLVWTGRELLY